MRSIVRRLAIVVALILVTGGAVAGATLLGVVSPAWLARVPLLERFATRWVPPSVPVAAARADVELAAPERAGIERLRSRLGAAQLVWSSNRTGNHELFLIDFKSGAVRQLTHDPHVDFLSRFSPDGRQIVFLRSQRPWVSFREESAWDLYVIGADGTGERRLAIEAWAPAWSGEGRVTFTRRNRLVELDVASGQERVLHDGAAPPTKGTVPEAALGPDGLTALSVRHVRPETVGVADLKAGTYTPVSTGRACQISWVPGERAVMWVDPTGRGGTRIVWRPMGEAGREQVLMDLPGEMSHEYFPRLSNDGAWLVWGASAGGHEHDRADYEIFVWQRGTPWEDATRLTHSATNDQWPDLFIPRAAR